MIVQKWNTCTLMMQISGKVLKYEAWTGVFVESIDVNGDVLDVVFY